MQRTPKIILLLIISLLPAYLMAQNPEIIATARINNSLQIQEDSISFDVRLIRHADIWDSWANGTFEIGMHNLTLDDNIGIELIDNTSELQQGMSGGILPEDTYLISPRIISERISITVAGPRYYDDCLLVPQGDSGIMIGRFLLYSKDKSPIPGPENLYWLEPYEYYQATAYKIQEDSLNIEMDNFSTTSVRYEVMMPDTCFFLKNFTAEYYGMKRVKLSWTTECEYKNRGFIIWRGMLPYSSQDKNELKYDRLVGRWDGTRPEEDSLVGAGFSHSDIHYSYMFDTVDFRGFTYCYLLQSQSFDSSVVDRAEACVSVPFTIISFAQANPNPFEIATTIKFRIEEPCYLTTTVRDIMGKEVKKLHDKQEFVTGNYEVEFRAPELSSQGLYDVIFVAYPKNDPDIEISRAVVKTQLVR